MPNPLLIMDYANMYCGSAPDDDGASNHLTLASVELPRLEVQYVDHRAGGAPVSIEIDVIQTRMECRFELVGVTRQVMQLLYGHRPGAQNFYIYGSVRDWMSGEAIQLEAFIRGQLGLVAPQKFTRGGIMSVEYAIRGIIAYTLSMGENEPGNEPIYDWSFFSNSWAVGGINQNGALAGREPGALFNIPV